jgi:hypothetical protein
MQLRPHSAGQSPQCWRRSRQSRRPCRRPRFQGLLGSSLVSSSHASLVESAQCYVATVPGRAQFRWTVSESRRISCTRNARARPAAIRGQRSETALPRPGPPGPGVPGTRQSPRWLGVPAPALPCERNRFKQRCTRQQGCRRSEVPPMEGERNRFKQRCTRQQGCRRSEVPPMEGGD